MRPDSQLVGEDKEPKAATLSRIFGVSGFVIVVGLMVGFLFSPDSRLFRTRIAPAVLFGAIGIGGLINVGLNLRFWREGRLLHRRVTPETSPARYWLLFALFTALSIISLMLAILFGAGLLVKTPAEPNHNIQRPEASRSAHRVFVAHWRLASAADAAR